MALLNILAGIVIAFRASLDGSSENDAEIIDRPSRMSWARPVLPHAKRLRPQLVAR
jgi:hypothetical protein